MTHNENLINKDVETFKVTKKNVYKTPQELFDEEMDTPLTEEEWQILEDYFKNPISLENTNLK